MKRLVFTFIALVSTLGVSQSMAQSATFPSRPVHIVVGTAPGGSNDLIARAVGQRLGEVLQQSVVIDNKPGVSGTPQGFTDLVVSETARWRPIVERAGLRGQQ